MKILAMTCVLILVSTSAYAENYQDSWKRGYREGATYSEGGIRPIAPITPIAPIRRVGETESDGYTRGLLKGYHWRQQRKNRGLWPSWN